MNPVSLIKCQSYEEPGLGRALELALQPLGGISAFVKPGQQVLLKPNLLGAAPPAKCHTTHPALVKAVGRLIQKAGGGLIIGDSPAIDPFKKVARVTGLGAAAAELGVPLVELKQPTAVSTPEGSVFASLEIAKQALDAEVVINLPKLKTHGQMLMTLGVKNLFGTIVAQRKAEWHHMTGLDRELFASLLLDIHNLVNPALTILDGVWGMEGNGPSNGPPRNYGLIAASPSALYMDLAVCRTLGIPLKRLPIYRAAVKRGLVQEDLSGLELYGNDPAVFHAPGLDIPKLDTMHILPAWTDSFTRRYMISKPVQKPGQCEGCLKCQRICPAGCIEFEGKKARFDYEACIRCYCCQEVCPQDAIGFKKGLIVKVLNTLGR
jgi:uncharacterized protein (DUF362 family)/Pyruvate/2-oxoacid:ferredoxin oxidoreductase delta subunit